LYGSFQRLPYFFLHFANIGNIPRKTIHERIRDKMTNAKKKALAAVILTAGFLGGCNTNGAHTTVSTDGSTSMEKVIGYLGEAYMEQNSDVKVTFNPTGSGSGIQAVLDGRCDIGLSSRDLTDEELSELDVTVVAFDGIAVIVNPENPVSDLSAEELARIFTGEITSWEEVGGEALPVVCIGREAASGTRDGFEAITGTADLCAYSQELTSTGDVIQTVSSNPNAVGYASVASVGDKVKTVSIDGVFPTNETILDGSYKIQRDFVFVTKMDKELSAAAQDFFDFAMSAEADEFIKKAGAVPARNSEETS
jgi:phosphate transport system substrate-binding protein